MKHIISISTFENLPDMGITKDEFESIKRASTILQNGRKLEEIYDILISSYLDFEKEVFYQAVELMVYTPLDYEQDFYTIEVALTRKLISLFTVVRLYRESGGRFIKMITGGNKDYIKRAFSAAANRDIEFQYLEVLRDYVQHQDLPVHLTRIERYRDSKGPRKEDAFVSTIEIFSRKNYLKKPRKRQKNKEKDLLETLPGDLNLKSAVRIYVEGVSNVHASVRKLVDEPLAEARIIFQEQHKRYNEFCKKEVLRSLRAARLEDDEVLEEVPLLLIWDDVRLKLVKRNRELVNLLRCYATGKIREESRHLPKKK